MQGVLGEGQLLSWEVWWKMGDVDHGPEVDKDLEVTRRLLVT